MLGIKNQINYVPVHAVEPKAEFVPWGHSEEAVRPVEPQKDPSGHKTAEATRMFALGSEGQ